MTSAVTQSRVRRLDALLSEELGTRSGNFGTPRARWRGKYGEGVGWRRRKEEGSDEGRKGKGERRRKRWSGIGIEWAAGREEGSDEARGDGRKKR